MEKVDKVIAGLGCCADLDRSCEGCSYDGVGYCEVALMKDALDVINGLCLRCNRLEAERDDLRKDVSVLAEELAQERPDEWRDNCDSYRCPKCGFETDNPNRLENRGVWCPRCGKKLRWMIPEVADGNN